MNPDPCRCRFIAHTADLSALISINLRNYPSPSVGAREDDVGLGGPSWSPVGMGCAARSSRSQQGRGPRSHPPSGDHEGHPYGSSGLLPLFMASVDAYWAPGERTYGCGRKFCEPNEPPSISLEDAPIQRSSTV